MTNWPCKMLSRQAPVHSIRKKMMSTEILLCLVTVILKLQKRSVAEIFVCWLKAVIMVMRYKKRKKE